MILYDLVFHRDNAGRLRITSDGCYRFDLTIREDDKPLITIKYFRIPKSLIRVLVPSNKTATGFYPIVEINRDLEDFMLAGAKKAVEEDAEQPAKATAGRVQ